VVRNTARLVAQGYNWQECIDFNETLVPVARHKAIKIMFALATHKSIKLFQMDVKSVFLNDFIEENMYVKQPPRFEDHTLPDHVFKLKKALYGLKQTLRAWSDRQSFFLLENGFMRGKVDITLLRREVSKYFIIVQIYVDDVIFGATNESLCNDFSYLMKNEFEMSLMGEL